MKKGKPYLSLKTLITLLVCGVVALSLIGTNILVGDKVAQRTRGNLADKATTISRMMAHSPVVVNSLTGQSEGKNIQTFANEIRRATNVDYVVIMDMKRIRKSHPEPQKVGKQFVGEDVLPALKGKEYTSVARGTLGLSMRAFTPVRDTLGRQVGVVAVGISLAEVQKAVAQSRSVLYLGTIFGTLIGIGGAILLARKIKQTLLGMEPYEIAKVLEERSAMLESVREGILAVDIDGRVTLVNAEATRILKQAGLDGNPLGRKAEEVIANTRLNEVLNTGESELDEELDIQGVTILSNRVPVVVDGETVGAIATFRDKTELSLLAEQLTGVRLYADALRAQSHEFMNKLHVILGMVHMKFYDELKTYESQIAQQQQSEMGFAVKRVKDPVVAGFILGKLSYARETGTELVLSEDRFLPESVDVQVSHELVTILGNLIDNAIEAVAPCCEKVVGLDLVYEDGQLVIQVSDTGPGISHENKQRIFTKGYSTKAGSRGLGLNLVKTAVDRLSGSIEILELAVGTAFRVEIPYEIKGEWA